MAGRSGGGRLRVVAASGVLAATLAACASAPAPSPRLTGTEGLVRAYNRPYAVRGRWYTPADQPGYDRVGVASWYSYESSSRTTADGEPFDPRLASAAHTTLPIPSWIEVTNLDNGRSARIRLNDRGPFAGGRILDVSRAAAVELGFLQRGTARVRVRYLGPAEPPGVSRSMWAAAAPLPRSRAPHPALSTPTILADAEVGSTPSVRHGAGPSLAQAEVDADLADFAPAALDAASTGFAVQAGAFSDRGNAERAAARLASAGPIHIAPLALGDGGVVYRVLVGGWPEAEEASAARERVAALGFADARVVAP